MYTPERIDRLEPNQIFVFGSNLQGHHAGGAARVAHQKFGAIWGQGVGLQGQSYAIPTMQGGVETIKPYVDEFIQFAQSHKEYTFLVTRIGCGIAGFKDSEIAPLFSEAVNSDNIILPREFAEVLSLPEATRRTLMKNTHGQVRTLADIVIDLNKEKHYSKPDHAIRDLQNCFQRIADGGDEIAFIAVRILRNSLDKAFTNGSLDVEQLRGIMENFDVYNDEWKEAYLSYCLDKLLKIVTYFNDFRRYKDDYSLSEDLREAGVFNFSHCNPQREPYYFNIACYPFNLFCEGIKKNWKLMTTNGVLDSRKLNSIMFDTHQRGIRKYGLDAVISHDFGSGGPCNPDVFYPMKEGTAPVYVKKDRDYIKSCGDGKGQYSIPDFYEIQYALPILRKCQNYTYVNGFFIPKEDYTLPVYHERHGKMTIPPGQTAKEFIDNLKQGRGNI